MNAALPLSGLRVLDSADEKGELCGRLLADLGADVVRVEPPGGAGSRRLPPFHSDTSLYFAVRNTNKRSIVVDLDDQDGREQLLGLLSEADVWIESNRPGSLAAMGLEPAELVERFSGLVITSITDFGATGPYRDFEGTDAVLTALSWMLFKAGVPDRPPVLPPGALAYDIAGITAAFATLTAHRHQQRTGRGQWVDLSVMESVAQTTDWALAGQSTTGGPPPQSEIRDGAGPLYPIVPCADGWVRPSVVTVAEWRKMRAWLGEPAQVQDERYDTTGGRIVDYHDVIRPLYEEHFRDRKMIEASEDGQQRRIPITPLLRPADVLTAPQYESLGSFAEIELEPGVTGRVASGFFLVDGERVGVRQPPPPIGAADDDGPLWEPRDRTTATRSGDPADAPYAGLRVLDFGIAGAGPEVARLLAEYGADVIRVESPQRPDLFRQLGGPSGISAVFASSSRSKRSFGANFTDPEAVRLVLELVKTADLVVENLPPGTMDRWGLGWGAIHAANPDAVLFSSQTMGTTGPWKDWRGYGANTQPVGGLTYLWSFPDSDEPVASNVAFPDHVVGRLGAVAAAAYLIGRERTAAGTAVDTGKHIEIVQAEVCLNVLADLFLEESLAPGTVGPRGNRSDRGAPWGVYQCSGDQHWCVITCRSDDEWRSLVECMGSPAWATDPALTTEAGRRARHDEVDDGITGWTSERTDTEVMHALQAAGVPAGRMMYVSEQPSDPHLRDRGYISQIEQPGLGPMLLDGPGFRSSGIPGPITTAAPYLGEHTRDIAASDLHLSAEDIARLTHSGALHQNPQPTKEA
ncbi:MAG: CoA transferase [Acidimicrobiia bacterium]|nr:CoA transferase [Acidimicrobiia bacterium]